MFDITMRIARENGDPEDLEAAQKLVGQTVEINALALTVLLSAAAEISMLMPVEAENDALAEAAQHAMDLLNVLFPEEDADKAA